MTKYIKEYIYNDMLIKNKKGEGDTYKIILNGNDNVTLVGVTCVYNNTYYSIDSLIEHLSSGEYVEISTPPDGKSLPTKFYIKRDANNYKIINDWFKSKTGVSRRSANAYLYYPSFHGASHFAAKSLGYIEIDFERFQKAINPINDSYSIF